MVFVSFLKEKIRKTIISNKNYVFVRREIMISLREIIIGLCPIMVADYFT